MKRKKLMTDIPYRPNFSGKSVILKTVALLTILSQIGSFVPATKAVIGIVDRIFTRISSMETVGAAAFQRESTFSIDVQQIASMLRCFTPSSLLLCDEFGKGTNSLDGTSLLAAVISYLSSSQPNTPRVIFTTYLVEMFDAHLIDEEKIVFGEMSVEFNDQEPVPLFRLITGKRSIGDSYGIACAKRSGICLEVVQRATEFSERLSNNLPLWRPDERTFSQKAERTTNAVNNFLKHDGLWESTDVNELFRLLNL